MPFDVAPGIITNGLGGNASNMIVGHFHLGFLSGAIVIPPRPVGAGGAGWPDQTEKWDKDIPRSIIITVKYKEHTIERIYVVSSKKAEFVIAVSNFINNTKERIVSKVKEIRHKSITIIAKFIGSKNKK